MLKDKKLACLLGAGDGDGETKEYIAHANLAEIETGKMALEKGRSSAVKKFAQKMIDDHTKARNDLEKLASARGVQLPTETDVQHKTMATALEALSGDTFDNQYIKRVGVGDHQRTHDLLKKVGSDAKDAQPKAYAAKTIRTVDAHLAKKMDGGK